MQHEQVPHWTTSGGGGGGGGGGSGGGSGGSGGADGGGSDGGFYTQSKLQSPCGSSPCGTVSLLSRGHASPEPQWRFSPVQLISFPLPVQPQRSDTR
jgi:hypothetical protein